MEQFELEGTFQNHLVQTALLQVSTFFNRTGCLEPYPTWPRTLPEVRHPQLLWEICSTILTVKNFFLISNIKLANSVIIWNNFPLTEFLNDPHRGWEFKGYSIPCSHILCQPPVDFQLHMGGPCRPIPVAFWEDYKSPVCAQFYAVCGFFIAMRHMIV